LPTWQRRGTGFYWEEYEKQGYSPIHAKDVVATRRRVKVDEELPMKEAYEEFIYRLVDPVSAS
jgi:tRNA(His) 5'-end guanylyltransferase